MTSLWPPPHLWLEPLDSGHGCGGQVFVVWGLLPIDRQHRSQTQHYVESRGSALVTMHFNASMYNNTTYFNLHVKRYEEGCFYIFYIFYDDGSTASPCSHSHQCFTSLTRFNFCVKYREYMSQNMSVLPHINILLAAPQMVSPCIIYTNIRFPELNSVHAN